MLLGLAAEEIVTGQLNGSRETRTNTCLAEALGRGLSGLLLEKKENVKLKQKSLEGLSM